MIDGNMHYMTIEKPFVDYFDRLRSIGMTFDEIESKLPQLLDYYQDMVIDKWGLMFESSLVELFENWKKARHLHDLFRDYKEKLDNRK